MNGHNDATPIIERIRFSALVTLSLGTALLSSVAYFFGEQTFHNVILAALLCTFLFGGGLIGLLVSHHVTQTHLPEGEHDALGTPQMSAEELKAAQAMRRAKGFLGLFTLTSETVNIKGVRSNKPPRFRRT